MGIYKFSKKMFISDLKKSTFYIIAIAFMTAFMFNAINISYNEAIYNEEKNFINVENWQTKLPSDREIKEIEIISMPIKLIQKSNLLILLCISAFYGIFCNISHIKRKAKEVAFILSNGASLIDVSRYLIYTNGVNYLIGVGIGLVGGILLIPIFNKSMYIISGNEGKLFTLTLSAMILSLIYVLIQLSIVVILNFGYVYRHDLIDLYKAKNTISITDRRSVRTPGFIYLLLYILSLGLIIYLSKLKGGENGVGTLGYLSMIGLYGVIKHFIPQIIAIMKNKKIMFKNNRRIYISNLQYSLSNSIVYFIGTILVLNYFLKSIVKYPEAEGIVTMSIFGIVSAIAIISLTLVYSLLVDTSDKMYIYKQLQMLGYKKNEVLKIINRESLGFFILGLFLTLIISFSSIYTYALVDVLSKSSAFQIGLIELIPLIIAGILSNRLNKKKVINEIYIENNYGD